MQCLTRQSSGRLTAAADPRVKSNDISKKDKFVFQLLGAFFNNTDFTKKDSEMKRLVLFSIGLVFTFCISVMAADKPVSVEKQTPAQKSIATKKENKGMEIEVTIKNGWL